MGKSEDATGDEYCAVRSALAAFDPLSLATAIAGLQTVPANAHTLWRLSVVAGLANGVVQPEKAQPLAGADLEAILNQSALATRAVVQEDPLDSPLTEEAAFHGGSYLVGGGLGEDAPFAFRHLARGCLRSRDGLAPALAADLRRTASAALTIGDSALRAAGLTANLAPGERVRVVQIPSRDTLIDLQKAMAFDVARQSALLPREGLSALEPLVLEAGERAFSDQEVNEGAADSWPLLRSRGWLVLLRPFDILVALRQHISLKVSEEHGAQHVEELFGRSVDEDVVDALRRMGLERPEIRARRGELPFTEIRARVDTDKVVFALVLVDDFEGISSAHPYTTWNAIKHAEAVATRVDELADELVANGQQALGLVLSQPAGRLGLMPLPSSKERGLRVIGMTAANLDTIAVLETEERLALWKFAGAQNSLTESGSINTSSMLDVYGAYRDEERSFHAMRGYDRVTIPPGASGEYRCRATASRNRHGALDVDGSVREVERIPGPTARADRLHFEVEPDGERLRIHIAAAPLSLWVVGPGQDVRRSWDAVESVAYWLGELCEPLDGLLGRLAEQIRALRIEVDFVPWGFWFDGESDPGGEIPGAVSLADRWTARLELGPAIRRNLVRPDNAGERELVALLIEALSELAASMGLQGVDRRRADEARDAASPFGKKKHLIMLPAEANPMIEAADGPIRLVQQADLSEARYALGDRLHEQFGFTGEKIRHERRAEVLKFTVDMLLTSAYQTLEEASSEDLIEWLVAQNERLIATSEHRRTILPVRLATYPDSAKTLRDEVTETNQAGICCRFLIERAVAQPPRGESSWSLSRYDQAMAVVAEALTWADLYDAIRGRLTNVDLLVRDDGLLRLVEADLYDSGRSQFFDRHITTERRRSDQDWPERFRRTEEGGGSELLARLDSLMVDEAGVSLSRLGETLVAANELSRQDGANVMVMPRARVAEALASLLIGEVPAEEIDRAISYLTMGPRKSFLKPPEGGKNDVYPWLFARRWSYNRRPFLLRSAEDGDEIIWGRRQVIASLQILNGQLEAGQFQKLARSGPLLSELGRMADERGHSFEREVASRFRDFGYAVEANLDELDGSKLERISGEDLGDIDVLAADQTRKILWAVECKALSGSLSSSEVVREMSDHFGGDSGTSVAKHDERVRWLGERVDAALDQLGISGSEGWELRGLICTGRDVIAPFIEELPFDLVSLDDLGEYLNAGRG